MWMLLFVNDSSDVVLGACARLIGESWLTSVELCVRVYGCRTSMGVYLPGCREVAVEVQSCGVLI